MNATRSGRMNDEVPDLLRRLWRLPSSPRRLGRRSILDVDTVVRTAVRRADEGGLESATLPKVAEELGVTAMSLYRHVGSKQELLQLMIDAASAPGPPSSPTDAGWREGLQQWALDLWALFRARPWVPRIPIHRAPSGPHQLAWLERGAEHLAPTGLDWHEKLTALTLLTGVVRQSAVTQQELEEGRESGRAHPGDEQRYGAALRLLLEADGFPQTSAMLDSEELTEGDADRDFLTVLEIVLDGLSARVDRASRPPS